MTEKAVEKIGIVLKYDAWDDAGNRVFSAPIEGVNDEGMPVRTEVTLWPRDLAEKLVRSGKAEAPLK